MEFALILPVLLLLLLVAIDFGRALYGWVILQNSARIAANFAGLNPDAWEQDIATVKARYQADISADLDTANCSRPGTPTTPLPDPVFTDGPDTSVAGGNTDTQYDVGDTVVVRLTCNFQPLTPIISAILGNSIQLGASSEFRIRVGDVAGLPNPTRMPPPATPTPSIAPSASVSVPPSVAPPVCPAPIAQFVGTPLTGQTPLTVTFTDQSTTSASCPITSWSWDFGDGQVSNQPNPIHQFIKNNNAPTQRFRVILTITTAGGSDAENKNNYISVSP